MARGAGGKVIMIGSLMSTHGLPYLTIYAITKGALAQLAKVLAAEWGQYNIQVNTIAPGFIDMMGQSTVIYVSDRVAAECRGHQDVRPASA